ncbi:hypothetical protein HII28_16485 [Planctomonas sp. JC2975]|uniref:hypothetical protein n=1 Tax=Planctomonas sp. JC2975 TaxID=2729626 RepID=UPI0014731DB0|nr:hypothetical protein [Planctomonas sp. JC2975]NNC13466.1 hypothetical protein [Planctomonas sp. JC2975]
MTDDETRPLPTLPFDDDDQALPWLFDDNEPTAPSPRAWWAFGRRRTEISADGGPTPVAAHGGGTGPTSPFDASPEADAQGMDPTVPFAPISATRSASYGSSVEAVGTTALGDAPTAVLEASVREAPTASFGPLASGVGFADVVGSAPAPVSDDPIARRYRGLTRRRFWWTIVGVVVVAIVVVASFVGIGMLRGAMSTTSPIAEGGVPVVGHTPVATAVRGAVAAHHVMRGVILSRTTDTLRIRRESGGSVTVRITPQTQLGTTKAPLDAAQLVPGTRIVVVGSAPSGGVRLAQRITLMSTATSTAKSASETASDG